MCLDGRVVAQFCDRLEHRAVFAQGDCHAAVGDRYVTRLMGQCPRRRRQSAVNRLGRFVVFQQQPASLEQQIGLQSQIAHFPTAAEKVCNPILS